MKQGFNFLKPQVEPPSVWTKVYDWIVNTARVILVFVEVTVIVALIIRITVDVQAKQLDEKIKNLESLMQSRELEEAKYRNLQNRIKSYDEIWTKSNDTLLIMGELTRYLPPSATMLSITMEKGNIAISGEALNSEVDVSEQALKESLLLSMTQVRRLTSDQLGQSNYVKFDFSSEVKEFSPRKVFAEDLVVSPTP